MKWEKDGEKEKDKVIYTEGYIKIDIEIENTRLIYIIYIDRYADIKAHRDMYWQRHRQRSKVNCDTSPQKTGWVHMKRHTYIGTENDTQSNVYT